MKGIRTDCTTGKSREVELTWKVVDGDFYILNGPTGYEGFRVTDTSIKNLSSRTHWIACMGTTGLWDRLEVYSEEVIKALREYAQQIGDVKLWNALYVKEKSNGS